MLGRTNTGGGGSGGLNFQVIGGTTAPSNPKENTIWVNTSTAITSYVFSATQPTGSAGMVWITTAASSTVAFNALKKNGIQVYPISAKQYIGGAWVDKTAKSWQGGKWVEWIPESVLYRSDLPYTATIEATNYINSGSFSGTSPNLVNNTERLTMSVSGINKGWSLFSKKMIDFSKYTKMVADIKVSTSSSGLIVGAGFTTAKKAGYSLDGFVEAKVTTARQTLTLDLSGAPAKGYAFISQRTNGESFTVDVYDWHLE